MAVVRAGSEIVEGVEVKLDSAATDGTFSVLELRLPPDAGAGFHRHSKEPEAMVVVDGELVVADSDREEALRPGDTVLFRRGTRHLFRAGETGARALVICAPAGLEELFRALAKGDEPAEATARAGVEFEAGS